MFTTRQKILHRRKNSIRTGVANESTLTDFQFYKMIKFFTVLQFLLSFSTVFLIVSVESSRVKIVNNGYNNLVVAIDPEVKKSQSVTIIENIKVILFYLLMSFVESYNVICFKIERK